METPRTEMHTTVCCVHPYFGYVNTPNAVIDFSDRVPAEFGHGAVATIDANGFRNPTASAARPDDEYWIGVFGGSVAFGVPASSDEQTISGCLERRLAGARADGRRVRVLNFAIPGGQQPQQLLMVTLNWHRLDAAITFDGVNEVVVPSCYNLDSVPPQFPYLPYYSALSGQAVSDEQVVASVVLRRRQVEFARRPKLLQKILGPIHAREVSRRRRQLQALQDTAPFQSVFATGTSSAEERAIGGADSWARHTKSTAMLCRSVGVASLHAVQPIPDREKPLTSSERERATAQAEVIRLREIGYGRVLEHAHQLRLAGFPVEDFSDVFAGCTQAIYTDLIHFEDRGSLVVADRLATRIVESWDGFRL